MAAGSDGDWERTRREIVAALRAGRLTRREVARECGVSLWTVREWVRREARPSPARPRFVAVDVRDPVVASVISFEVVLAASRVVRVPPGFDAADLVRLVRALESC